MEMKWILTLLDSATSANDASHLACLMLQDSPSIQATAIYKLHGD